MGTAKQTVSDAQLNAAIKRAQKLWREVADSHVERSRERGLDEWEDTVRALLQDVVESAIGLLKHAKAYRIDSDYAGEAIDGFALKYLERVEQAVDAIDGSNRWRAIYQSLLLGVVEGITQHRPYTYHARREGRAARDRLARTDSTRQRSLARANAARRKEIDVERLTKDFERLYAKHGSKRSAYKNLATTYKVSEATIKRRLGHKK